MPTAPLPPPRGELTFALFGHLAQEPHDLPLGIDSLVGATDDDELQLALCCLYELHYRGFAGVDAGWEWQPSVLKLRAAAEKRFETRLRHAVGPVEVRRATDVADSLWSMATDGSGPSLSGWVSDRASLAQLRELFVHRSAYQLKEADPHTWGIPRLSGRAKAVMTAIQADEYGGGDSDEMHSSLFSVTMRAAGLDPTPNAYLDLLPGSTLATTNLISLLGLHRRLRGALVGHLALFEMTSTGPMGRYSDAMRRLGLPEDARRFFDIHVQADERHQHMAVEGMVGGLMEDEPGLAADVVLGARMLTMVERDFTRPILRAWEAGSSSLRRPTRSPGAVTEASAA